MSSLLQIFGSRPKTPTQSPQRRSATASADIDAMPVGQDEGNGGSLPVMGRHAIMRRYAGETQPDAYGAETPNRSSTLPPRVVVTDDANSINRRSQTSPSLPNSGSSNNLAFNKSSSSRARSRSRSRSNSSAAAPAGLAPSDSEDEMRTPTMTRAGMAAMGEGNLTLDQIPSAYGDGGFQYADSAGGSGPPSVRSQRVSASEDSGGKAADRRRGGRSSTASSLASMRSVPELKDAAGAADAQISGGRQSRAASVASDGSALGSHHVRETSEASERTVGPGDAASTTTSTSNSSSAKSNPYHARRKQSASIGGKNGIASALASSGLALGAHGAGVTTASPPQSPPRTSWEEGVASVRPRRSFSNASSLMLPDGEEELSFGEAAGQITGFAVASAKRNTEFHDMFPSVPEEDYLIEDYGCALQREILIQGRLYISENHLCYNANIFGWVTTLIVPFSEIVSIEKKMTAFVIPNAIQISTLHAKHSFASFLSRDTTYDVILNIWRLSHPSVPVAEDGDRAALEQSALADDSGSLSPVDATGGAAASRRASNDRPAIMHHRSSGARKAAAAHRPTKVPEGMHFTEVAMEATFPTTPEQIYNLMFTSGFIKDFMQNDQKLMDIQISDWAPKKDGSHLLSRSMSYIKPLNGSVGPKQTKCLLEDENEHVDFDDYVIVLTTTRTPDVPSGGAFSVKTRTSICWAGSHSSKVHVTTKVEWTGRSMLKGIIERSAVEGQKTYHRALEAAMRAYIQEHSNEFLAEGGGGDDAAPAAGTAEHEAQAREAQAAADEARSRAEVADKIATDKAHQSTSQWLLDLAFALPGQIVDVLGAVFSTISELVMGGSLTSVLVLLVAVLLASNLYTLNSLRSPRAVRVAPRSGGLPLHTASARAGDPYCDAVAADVKGFLEDLFREGSIGPPAERATTPVPVCVGPRQEVERLMKALDGIEERVRGLRAVLSADDLD